MGCAFPNGSSSTSPTLVPLGGSGGLPASRRPHSDAGLLILPMNKMLFVECSRIRTKKGLSTLMISGMLMGMISMVVLAAALVPVSSTSSTARWDTCGVKMTR